LNELKLIKLFKDKVVAQKSLNKKSDRIENARDTIFVLDKKFKSDTILLIDDAI
jgi:predicted amidophosphoribosyltransferase